MVVITNYLEDMKIILYFICIFIFVIGCNSGNNEKRSSIPPPDTTMKYEIHYKGKIYQFNKNEYKRFLDSLNIKDTAVHGLD